MCVPAERPGKLQRVGARARLRKRFIRKLECTQLVTGIT